MKVYVARNNNFWKITSDILKQRTGVFEYFSNRLYLGQKQKELNTRIQSYYENIQVMYSLDKSETYFWRYWNWGFFSLWNNAGLRFFLSLQTLRLVRTRPTGNFNFLCIGIKISFYLSVCPLQSPRELKQVVFRLTTPLWSFRIYNGICLSQ